MLLTNEKFGRRKGRSRTQAKFCSQNIPSIDWFSRLLVRGKRKDDVLLCEHRLRNRLIIWISRWNTSSQLERSTMFKTTYYMTWRGRRDSFNSSQKHIFTLPISIWVCSLFATTEYSAEMTNWEYTGHEGLKRLKLWQTTIFQLAEFIVFHETCSFGNCSIPFP